MSEPIRRVVVVIPACDEAMTIGSAVSAVRASAGLLAPRVAVEVVVVANGCTDDTAGVARRAGARVLVRRTANVGAARAVGGELACRAVDLTTGWIASTDADSRVPAGWLPAQLEAAEAGADLFLGTIALEPEDVRHHVAWARRYAERDGAGEHRHVHGANLGVRASAYEAVGGFDDLAVHEDVDLVDRLLRHGARAEWSEAVPVITSARHHARLVGGVATDLAVSAQWQADPLAPPSHVA